MEWWPWIHKRLKILIAVTIRGLHIIVIRVSLVVIHMIKKSWRMKENKRIKF
jgi:hypothetical protein